jgi:MoaA/NifB/PqqE/SkfB family radical SAM enzyme
MQKVKEIKTLHIELTDKCQAQCPMCARNYYGGKTRPFIKNGDISIEDFKKWFSKDFLSQLTNFYSCGNYGDPAFAKDCLEIFAYVRECNPITRLAIHTNGGMRNPDWWAKLAKYNVQVIFAIDGFKGKHELYRKNTNFDKVIENLKGFVEAGGDARVDSLVFAHNEYETEELETFLLTLGVKSVNFISTTRFYEMAEFKVLDNNGNVEYTISPAQTPKFKRTVNNSLNALLSKKVRDEVIETATIEPICENENGIYVDPYGHIFPCCWIGSDYVEHPIEENLLIHRLRNISVENTKKIMETVGVHMCQSGILNSESLLFEELNNFWVGKNKCITCVKVCSKALYNNRKTI